MTPIQFYFELASPYSYLASLEIDGIGASVEREIEWCPVDIAAVWKAHGVFEAYASIRALKRSYIARDAQRCALSHGVRLARPAARTRDTSVCRLAYWGLAGRDRTLAKRFIQAVWHRYYAEGGSIDSLEDLDQASAGLSVDRLAIAEAAAMPQAQHAQDRCNTAAIEAGCFGIPWFVADGESFFGQDRLDQLAAFLRDRVS